MSTLFQGTWDFKWPQGKKIRVAFQELSPKDPIYTESSAPQLIFPALVDKYKVSAALWLSGGANISFEFLQQTLPAPVDSTKDLRSPSTGGIVEYDVLVSFASSPSTVVFVDRENQSENTVITGQLSVLGSYARRIHYGTPTTLVGPNRDFAPTGKKLREYFDDPAFRDIVLHEVGHVLGIAHQHQNPLYRGRPALKDSNAIKSRLADIREVYWTQFEDQIEEEIVDLWRGAPESPRGTIPFSDWYEFSDPGTGLKLEDLSVMVHPVWSELVYGAQISNQKPTLRNEPTPWDLAVLGAMYPIS